MVADGFGYPADSEGVTTGDAAEWLERIGPDGRRTEPVVPISGRTWLTGGIVNDANHEPRPTAACRKRRRVARLRPPRLGRVARLRPPGLGKAGETMKELWQELAAIQAQLEQVHAKLTALALRHTEEDDETCCDFCHNLKTAVKLLGDTTESLSDAVAKS